MASVGWISAAVPKGGAGELLLSVSQEAVELLHLRLQQSVLVLALVDEVFQTLGHVQLALRHLLYSQTKLREFLSMLAGGLKLGLKLGLSQSLSLG